MDDLLQQGITAYKAGMREEARKIFITVVKQNPENDRAWGWMYDVSNNDKERTYFLKQMLRINPNNKKASQLLKELTAYNSTSNLGGRLLKPVVYVSIILICLIGICSISILFFDNTVVASIPTNEAMIPIETIIGLTYSAARAQTAISYSATPLSTSTSTISIENVPTATIFIFPLQTNSSQPTEYIYSTNTPFIYTQPTLIVVPPTSGGGSGGTCCKHCGSTSKPCGDTCISNNFTCHVSSGCACY